MNLPPVPLHVLIPPLHRGADLPDSIPYLRDTNVPVQIHPSLAGTADAVQFSVSGCSAQHGEAVVVQGDSLQTTGVVRLRGTQQTQPGFARRLRLIARLNGGHPAWASEPFSVCAHPCGVANGPHCVPQWNVGGAGVEIGMEVKIVIASDSGTLADLDEVEESEVVSPFHSRSVSLQGHPTWAVKVQQKPQPLLDVDLDFHGVNVLSLRGMVGAKLLGTTGDWSQDQFDEFQCARCGMEAPAVIPESGYRITRIVEIDAAKQLWLVVRKYGCPCTIGVRTSKAGATGLLEVRMRVPPANATGGFAFP